MKCLSKPKCKKQTQIEEGKALFMLLQLSPKARLSQDKSGLKTSLTIQRVPALFGFWDFKKTALCKIRVSGTVGVPY